LTASRVERGEALVSFLRQGRCRVLVGDDFDVGARGVPACLLQRLIKLAAGGGAGGDLTASRCGDDDSIRVCVLYDMASPSWLRQRPATSKLIGRHSGSPGRPMRCCLALKATRPDTDVGAVAVVDGDVGDRSTSHLRRVPSPAWPGIRPPYRRPHWVLASTGLVMVMVPGLAFFYGGLVSSRTVLVMLQQNMFPLGLVSILQVLAKPRVQRPSAIAIAAGGPGWAQPPRPRTLTRSTRLSVVELHLPCYVAATGAGDFIGSCAPWPR
jgi:hypothetical protein